MPTCRVAFVYSAHNPFYSAQHHDQCQRRFFMGTMAKDDRIDYSWGSALPVNADVVILNGLDDSGDYQVPCLDGLQDTTALKLVMMPDLHDITPEWVRRYLELGIDLCIGNAGVSPRTFYTKAPGSCLYFPVVVGIDRELYEKPPGNRRCQDFILLSGVIGRHPTYALRRLCAGSTHVVTAPVGPYVGDRYPGLLHQYKAGIATSRNYMVRKYFELTMAGLVTFMEDTPGTDLGHYGFEDGTNAVFITEGNYEARFLEYMESHDDPKWDRIARAGQVLAVDQYDATVQARRLVDRILEWS